MQQRRNTEWIQKQPLATKLLMLAAVVVVVILYLYGTFQQGVYVNNDGGTDQISYRSYTIRLYNDLLHIDGNRMPLFPLIVRLLYPPGLERPHLLEIGKVVGIGVSVIALTAIAIIFYHHFRLLLAANMVLITMFTVFIFKAPYYQPELLFFTLYFVAFVLICKAFNRLTPALAVAIGVFLGVAMLTKASAASTLALFVVLMLTQIILRARTLPPDDRPRRVLKRLAYVAIVIVVFLVLLSGYMASSRRIFGPLFYNVNTTFYMWYDSWEEVVAGTRAYGDRRQWPQMPEDEIPSLSRYLTEHTPGDIYRRIKGGLQVSFNNHCRVTRGEAFNYCQYAAIFAVAAMTTVLLNVSLIIQVVRRNILLIIFCGLFFISHILLAAWWVPLSAGRRFLMPIYLPLMYVLSSVITLPGIRRFPLRLFSVRTDAMTMFLIGVLFVVIVDITRVVSSDILQVYGGD